MGIIIPLFVVIGTSVWYLLLWYYGENMSMTASALEVLDLQKWQWLVILLVAISLVFMFIWMYMHNWSVYKLPPDAFVPGEKTTAKSGDVVVTTAVAEKKEEKKPEKKEEAKVEVKKEEPKRAKFTVTKKEPEVKVEAQKKKEKKEETKVEVVEGSKPKRRGYNIVTFPHAVGGGIYYDSYIRIGTNTMLKLRSECVEEVYLL